ncbi:ARM repeat superfamily protein [Abeliophyllum distichum]|uniref:Protein SDA1 n=1 Tax=Abeliophyllum distichum TaxID=126358 RepID=A0ABD1PNQ8_9LAMI
MVSTGPPVQDSISASGRASEKLSLPALQSKMKSDPEGYLSELTLIYNQFKSSLELFEQQAALNFTSLSGIAIDPTVAKDLGDRVMFLAHVTPFYPKQLAQFPKELAQFLKSSARSLPSGLRVHVTQALILLSNRKIVDIVETLELFMDLQTFGDRVLRNLAFSRVITGIRRMNQNHKNDPKNRALQNILFGMLQVWFDDRTANAICMACFHVSSRIMTATLSFLLDFEKIENDDDTYDSGSEDDLEAQQTQIAKHKGTTSSKKKKKAKFQRVIRSMKKQQRLSSESSNNSNYFSPLNHLKDAQVKMMMLKVISRTVGLHRLILLNFYPYLQKYIQVPPDAVEPLFKQIVNQFVHDRSCTEVCPSLLIKKDRGRPTDPKARPKAFGEVQVASNVPGVELLEQDDHGSDDDIDVEGGSDDDNENVDVGPIEEGDSQCESDGSSDDGFITDYDSSEDDVREDEEVSDNDDDDKAADHADDISDEDESDEDEDKELNEDSTTLLKTGDTSAKGKESKAQKRKFSDFDGQLNAASKSVRALKKLAGEKVGDADKDTNDGILSNEDFQRIKELKTKKEAKIALTQHGFKIPSSDQLSTKRVDAATLETGGSSNQQKEHKKAMPLAAKRSKIARVRVEKKKKQQRSGKQFRGRKAWK